MNVPRFSSLGSAVRGLYAVARSDTAVLMLSNLTAAVVGIVTGVVGARALGPAGRGDLAVIVFWPSLIATLTELGVADALTYRIARRAGSVRKLITRGMLLAGASSSLGVLLGAVLLPWVLRGEQAALLRPTYAALIYVPLSAAAAVPVSALLGLQRYRAVAGVRVASAGCYTIAMVAAVLAGFGTVSVLVWLTVLARGLPLLFALPFLRRALPPSWGSDHDSSIRHQAADGARLHGARIAGLVGSSEDRVLASLMLSQGGIGLWQVSAALVAVMQFAPLAVTQHLFSSAARAPGDPDLVYRAYLRSVLVTGAAALVGVPLLPFAIPLLYGTPFAAAVPAAMVVMAATVFAAAAATLQAGAKAVMRTRACIVSELVGIAVMAAVAWPAVHAWAEVGIAVAFLAGRIGALFAITAVSDGVLGIVPARLNPLSPLLLTALARELRALWAHTPAEGGSRQSTSTSPADRGALGDP